jgi:hypothetical protein
VVSTLPVSAWAQDDDPPPSPSGYGENDDEPGETDELEDGASGDATSAATVTTTAPTSRFFVGGYFGLGSANVDDERCNGCDYDGISLGADLGYRLGASGRYAIVADIWINGGDRDGRSASLVAFDAGVRYFALPRLWLQGTLAITSLTEGPSDGPTPNARGGPGIEIGAGIELRRWTHLALDVRARLGFSKTGKDGDGSTVQSGVSLGLTWY